LLLAGLTLAGSALAEWVAPEGPPEFQVNQHAPNDQRIPVVAADADGRGVILWQSRNQDAQGWGVHARLIGVAGEPAGNEFRVNQFNTGNQEGQHVRMQADGRFLAIWHGPDRDSAASATVVQKRLFNADGTPLDSETRVSNETDSLQILPRLAWGFDGRMVMAWEGEGIVDNTFNILRRGFAADGESLFQVVPVNQYMISAQRRADAVMGPTGIHVIAWQSASQDGSDWGIFARCLDLDGPDGDEFLVNETTLGAQARPRLAMAADGAFAVAWQDNRGQSSFEYQRVMVRLYGPDCVPLGGEIQVNDFDDGIQDLPAIGVDGLGRYIVAWQSFPPDFEQQGIYGRWIDPAGQFLGASFRISQEIEAYQDYPAVTGLPDGGLLAAWETLGQDGSGFGIFARRLNAPQFIPPIEPLAVPALGLPALLVLILILLLPASRRLC
jgi:hypothetical protein